MNLNIRKVHWTESNLIGMMKDKSIYGICKWNCGDYHMKPIAEVEVGEIFNGKVELVQILESVDDELY